MQVLKLALLAIAVQYATSSQAQVWHPLGNDDNSYAFGNAHNYVRIALGAANTIYLTYQDGTSGNRASVKKYENGVWSYVGASGFSAGIAENMTIAIENGTTPYIAYRDVSLGYRTVVKKFDGTNWVNVGGASISAGSSNYSSIAVATDGSVYVAYKDNTNSGRTVARKFDGTNWTTLGPATGFSAGGTDYVCAALDQNDVFYVAYSDNASATRATVRKFDGSNWVTVGAQGFTPQGAQYIDLAIYGGVPYISYTDNANGFKASVRRFNGTSWEAVGTDGFSADITNYTSIALDNNGTVYVAYQDYSGTANGKASVKKFAGSSWETVGTEGFTAVVADYPDLAIAAGNIPVVSYTRFEIFARSYSLYPLPLSLLSFSGRLQNEQMLLRWSTTEEENSSHFAIERSSNGNEFHPIAQIPAAGNSHRRIDYQFSDPNYQPGKNYYRLKMLDLDGRFQYSAILMLATETTTVKASAFPVPASKLLTLRLELANSQRIQYSMVDMLGRTVLTKQAQLTKGVNVWQLSLENIPRGNYLIVFNGPETAESVRIIKQ